MSSKEQTIVACAAVLCAAVQSSAIMLADVICNLADGKNKGYWPPDKGRFRDLADMYVEHIDYVVAEMEGELYE